MTEKKYEINGVTYVQKPLVLGQLLPICQMLETVEIRSFSVQGIVSAFGGKLSTGLAVLLIPSGETVRDRDIDAIAAVLDEHMTAETALEVVADFLAFNPASSILAKVKQIAGSFRTSMEQISNRSAESEPARPTPYDVLYTTSPEATLPRRPGSSGM